MYIGTISTPKVFRSLGVLLWYLVFIALCLYQISVSFAYLRKVERKGEEIYRQVYFALFIYLCFWFSANTDTKYALFRNDAL